MFYNNFKNFGNTAGSQQKTMGGARQNNYKDYITECLTREAKLGEHGNMVPKNSTTQPPWEEKKEMLFSSSKVNKKFQAS